MYFLVYASPPKLLDVGTSNFAGGHRSHDVESRNTPNTKVVTGSRRVYSLV